MTMLEEELMLALALVELLGEGELTDRARVRNRMWAELLGVDVEQALIYHLTQSVQTQERKMARIYRAAIAREQGLTVTVASMVAAASLLGIDCN